MNRAARPVSLVSAVALALLLTGCTASQSKPVEDYAGEPKGVEAPPSSAGGASWGAWLQDGKQFGIVLYGSSTCPPKVESVHVAQSNQIQATLAPAPGGVCTKDYVPHTTVFTTPSGVTVTSDVTILLPSGNLTLPGLPH